MTIGSIDSTLMAIPPARIRVPFLTALLFCSGACALVYQMMWLREFRLIFGSSSPATAAVLAIFMGGIGLGAAWFGQRVERNVLKRNRSFSRPPLH